MYNIFIILYYVYFYMHIAQQGLIDAGSCVLINYISLFLPWAGNT